MLLMLGSASLFAKLDLNPYYFLISSFMYDSTGGFGITLGVAFASITVHSPPQDRLKNIVLGNIQLYLTPTLAGGLCQDYRS